MSRGFKHNTKTKGNESNKLKFLTRKRNAMNPSTEIWQVEPMIALALKYDGPALVEVMVSRQELSMPPTFSPGAGQRVQPVHDESDSQWAW
jgi:hypothetical protein